MHYQEFSKRIKEKYPQYNDIDDRELATKIVAKYPQYQVDFDDNRVAPQTVSTQQGTSNSSPTYPQVEQSPVVEQPTGFVPKGTGFNLLNPVVDLYNAGKNLKENAPMMAKEFAKSVYDNASGKGLANTLPALGRGIVSGAVDFMPMIAGLGVDTINSIADKEVINMPRERRQPMATTFEAWRDLQDTSNNLATPVVEGQDVSQYKKANPVMEYISGNNGGAESARFAEGLGTFLVPMGTVSKGVNAVRASQMPTKVAKESARIVSKLDDAQKLKYGKYADQLAQKKVLEKMNSPIRKFADDVVFGGALDTLEGENLQERFENVGGGALMGGAMHVGMKGAGKAYKKVEPKVNEAIKNASESDLISKGIANIDSMLNTNISKNANELTQKRKEYRDLISKDTSLAKNLTEEQIKALEKADELSTQEQLELFERNLQGDKKYSYADNKAKQKQKDQEVRDQQEAKEFFDNLLEEENASTAPVSEVSNPVDINTPKLEGTAVKTHELPASVNPKKSRKEKIARQQEIIEQQGGVKASEQPFNIDIKSQIEAKRRSKPRSFVVEKSGDNTYFHGEDGVSKVYGKNGKSAYVAEGARSLEKRTAGEENIYKNHEFYDNVVEDGVNKNYVKEGYHEIDASEPLYKYSQDTSPEFMKWYDEYSKADSKTKNKMLSEKLKSYKTQDEASKFYEKFSEQEMMGNQAKRAKKVGDETYDTADVSETRRLTEAIEKEDIQYEKANKTEVEDSKSFKAYVDKSWYAMPRGRMKNSQSYIKGVLNSCRDSASFQKEYNRFITATQKRGFSPKVQEAMVSEINAIADSVVANKKQFGVEYKKTEFKTGEIYKNAIKELQDANARGDLAKGKQIIERNDLKRKYLDANGQKALDEHYTKSVEKAHKGLSEIGIELSNENGTYTAKLNKEKAIEWAKNEVKAKIKDEAKLKKALDLLDKKPEVAIERAKSRGQKILDANKNIIANDIKFAYEAPQKQFKEGKLIETGDTWDRQSSDVDAGARRAEQTTKGIAEALRSDDGYTVKELSNAIKGFDKKSPEDVIKAYEKYGDLLDKQYIEESGKESVPVSELPSTRYNKIKKENAGVNLKANITNIIKNEGMSSYINSTSQGKRVYTNKTVTHKLKDVIKGNAQLERMFDKLGEIDVHFVDSEHPAGQQGFYNKKTNSIIIYTDGSNLAKTVVHEARHAIQEQLAKRSSFGSRWRKLVKSCMQRNKALQSIVKDEAKMAIVKRVEPLYNDLCSGKITKEQFVSLVSKDEAELFVNYNKALKKYKNAYLEKDARSVSEGNYGKRLFHKGQSSIRSELQRTKSKYSWIAKARYGLNEFGELPGESNLGKRKDSEWRDRSNDRRTGSDDGRPAESLRQTETFNEGKMDEANAKTKSIQEEKVVKFIENEFNQPTETYSKFESKSAEVRGVQHHFKELNKRAEELYTKYDTYTPEQMRNRLRQQGGGDDAVYFKQGGQAQGKVSFGEQENTKVGFTGEKKYDGLKQKGSTSQSLAMQFNRDIRLNHVDKCIEFFKRNFDNQPKEGFVPVNTKLLFNTMAHGKSKAFYETLMKGEDAIREVFTNKAQADNWVNFAERIKANEADLYIPKDLFEMSITGEKELPLDYLKTYGRKAGSVNQIKAMGKIAGAMLDYYNDRFKRKVLTSASFFTNNRFGNQIMLMANASSPAEYFRSIKDAIKLKDSDIPTEILESTLAEAVWQETGGKVGNKLNPLKGVKDNLDGKHSTKRYFSENRNNAFDNLVRVLDGVMINTESLSGGKKLLAQGANIALAIPNAVFKEISNTMMGINAKAERFERKQAFAQTLNKIQKDKVTQTARKMATVKHLVEEIKSDSILRQTVIDKVADVLGDYNNFNKFEKNFMKRIIPFYAWNRTILRHSIALCKDNPTKLALIALKTLELHTQDDGLEDYQHGALKTGIYDKTAGKNLVINKTKMIPYATLFDMASGESIGSISPGIKKPIEAVQGEKWFKPSSEIQNKRYKRMSHKGQKGYLDTKTGEFKEGSLPAGARLAYVGKDALETVYPHIGSPLTKGVLSKDVIDHHNKTGEWRLPDKQYDASLGGFYDGDYIGSYNGKAKKRSAKMKMDLGHQVANRLTGLSLQPEQRKAQKEKWKKQSRKLRGY